MRARQNPQALLFHLAERVSISNSQGAELLSQPSPGDLPSKVRVASMVETSFVVTPLTRHYSTECRRIPFALVSKALQKLSVCRWPKQKPAQALLLPFQVSGSAQRMKGDIAEARCQALPLHALHLSGHLLLQSQLPPFERDPSRRRERDSLPTKLNHQRIRARLFHCRHRKPG